MSAANGHANGSAFNDPRDLVPPTVTPSAAKGDLTPSVIVGAIYRGVEGQCFRSRNVWDDIAVPLIKNAKVGTPLGN